MYLQYAACPWPRVDDVGFSPMDFEDCWFADSEAIAIIGPPPNEMARVAIAAHHDHSPTTVLFQRWVLNNDGVFHLPTNSSIHLNSSQYIELFNFFNDVTDMRDNALGAFHFFSHTLRISANPFIEFYWDTEFDECILTSDANIVNLEYSLLSLMLMDLPNDNGDAAVPDMPAISDDEGYES